MARAARQSDSAQYAAQQALVPGALQRFGAHGALCNVTAGCCAQKHIKQGLSSLGCVLVIRVSHTNLCAGPGHTGMTYLTPCAAGKADGDAPF
jgi:hypothetical protein